MRGRYRDERLHEGVGAGAGVLFHCCDGVLRGVAEVAASPCRLRAGTEAVGGDALADLLLAGLADGVRADLGV